MILIGGHVDAALGLKEQPNALLSNNQQPATPGRPIPAGGTTFFFRVMGHLHLHVGDPHQDALTTGEPV